MSQWTGKHLVFNTQRRILPKPRKANKLKQKRPCSRTFVDVSTEISVFMYIRDCF